MAAGKAGLPQTAYLTKRLNSGKLDSSAQSHQPPKQSCKNATDMRGSAARENAHRSHVPEVPGSNPGPASTIIYNARSKELACPECGSQRLYRDGLRYPRSNGGDPVQRWLCRDCGYRFSLNGSQRPLQKASRWSINSASNISCSRQVCELLTEGSKNLAAVNTTQQNQSQAAGATTQLDEATIKGKLIEFTWWLKKEGYAESTIHMRSRNLRRLVKLGANLHDPESIKEIIANQSSWCVNTRANIVDSYHTFLRMLGLSWRPPRYKEERTFPFIPTETEIDTLIASCGNKTAAFLQTLKETAMRAGEAFRLEWSNIDIERRLINLTHPEKGSNPRVFKVSAKLIDMLTPLPKKSKRVFGKATLSSLRATFCASRKKAAKKLANPRLLQIHFHSFRHWKATMEYHKTKDPYHVKQLLGHKSLRNTEVYINLEQAIFSEGDDSEYTTRIAKTVKGARALLEVGFEYITDMDGFKLFRKRK